MQGLADLPADLYRRLHSEDPKVRFFGGDSADSCMKSLERQGLVYIDDFFILDGHFPDWCRVEVFSADGS